MTIIALIIVVFFLSGIPCRAQGNAYGYQNQGNGQAYQNSNNVAPGTIQPFQGLDSPPNMPVNSPSYAPVPAQFYQNPNYPLQGSMRVNRQQPQDMNSPMPNNGGPNYSQPYQNTYPPTNNSYDNSGQYGYGTSQSQNQQAPNYYYSNNPPSLKTGYPLTGGAQPFAPSAPPPASNVSIAARRQASDLINKAYALSHSGQNEEAIVLLKQAEAINPSSTTAHLDLSASYMALKDYDDALRETTVLLAMNPNDEKGYVNYLAAAIGANHMQDALRAGQEYLNRFPNGQNRTKLTNEMMAVEHELDRRVNTHGVMPPPGAPDNYLFYATPSGIRRWPAGSMPLKVYINNGSQYKGFSPEFQSVLIKSFMTWQNTTHGALRFVPVDDPRIANIECYWTDSAANVMLAAEAGEAKIETANNSIYHVNITLLTCRPESLSETLSPALLQQVCLHEIGHALGIDGHSDKAQDIMYCSTNPNVEHPQLTQRDVNTLYLIYQ